MLIDAVTLMHRDMLILAEGIAATRGPGEIIAADFDVVVGELAELVVVHAVEFGVLGGAQVEPWDAVYGGCEQEGDCEGPAGGGEDVGGLDVELLVFVVDPAACDVARADAVEADDVGCAEEGVGEEPEYAGDAVLGEDVHGVVDAEEIFDWVVSARNGYWGEWSGSTFSSVIYYDASDDTKND